MRRVLGFVAVLVVLAGCVDELGFDTPAGARVEFSVDTLSVDTVIAGLGTATHRFIVYNNSGSGVSITDVSFENGESNGWRVNVDGMYINDGLAEWIDVRDDDSLIVFVELTPEDFDVDEPVEVTTGLIFTLANGEEQRVVLEGWSQSVVVLDGVRITGSETLSAGRPFLVYDSLTVEEGAVLTVAAGGLFYFFSDALLHVDGTLIAEGTLEEPIVMRGHRTEMMFENQPYDRVSDQWVGVVFGETSYGNVLRWCDIHSAHDGIVATAASTATEQLRLENTIVHNMAGYCVNLKGSQAFIGNCQITNAADGCLYIVGGNVVCVHSTIANFYPFSSDRGAALTYTNVDGEESWALEQATFINSIVTGWSDDEVYGIAGDDESAAFNYAFYYCLLNTPEVTDDAAVVGCVWDRESNDVHAEEIFVDFNLDYLLFDFSLSSESPARGIGEVGYTQAYFPQDLKGVERLSDGASDAGCYEWNE